MPQFPFLTFCHSLLVNVLRFNLFLFIFSIFFIYFSFLFFCIYLFVCLIVPSPSFPLPSPPLLPICFIVWLHSQRHLREVLVCCSTEARFVEKLHAGISDLIIKCSVWTSFVIYGVCLFAYFQFEPIKFVLFPFLLQFSLAVESATDTLAPKMYPELKKKKSKKAFRRWVKECKGEFPQQRLKSNPTEFRNTKGPLKKHKKRQYSEWKRLGLLLSTEPQQWERKTRNSSSNT